MLDMEKAFVVMYPLSFRIFRFMIVPLTCPSLYPACIASGQKKKMTKGFSFTISPPVPRSPVLMLGAVLGKRGAETGNQCGSCPPVLR